MEFTVPVPVCVREIRKNGYVVIENRPCEVSEDPTSQTDMDGQMTTHLVGIDIFTGKELQVTLPSSVDIGVPIVARLKYNLSDIPSDGYVALMDEYGNRREDMKLPTDEALASKIMAAYNEGKDLIVNVMTAMGEEQIVALKYAQ